MTVTQFPKSRCERFLHFFSFYQFWTRVDWLFAILVCTFKQLQTLLCLSEQGLCWLHSVQLQTLSGLSEQGLCWLHSVQLQTLSGLSEQGLCWLHSGSMVTWCSKGLHLFVVVYFLLLCMCVFLYLSFKAGHIFFSSILNSTICFAETKKSWSVLCSNVCYSGLHSLGVDSSWWRCKGAIPCQWCCSSDGKNLEHRKYKCRVSVYRKYKCCVYRKYKCCVCQWWSQKSGT